MRELLQISLSEFECTLRKHSELEDRLATEPDMIIFGTSIAVSTEKLKYGVYTEIKGNTNIVLECTIIHLVLNYLYESTCLNKCCTQIQK